MSLGDEIAASGEVFRAAAEQFADRTAVAHGLQTRTYAELYASVVEVATQLSSSCTVRPGARIAVMSADPLDRLVLILASQHLQALTILIEPNQPPARIDTQLAAASADLAARLHEGALDVHLGTPDSRASRGASPTTGFGFFTSGTTGTPRLVEWSGATAIYGSLPGIAPFPLQPGDQLLSVCPLGSARVVGEIYWPLLHGATVRYLPASVSLDPRGLREALSTIRPAVLNLPPVMIMSLCQEFERPDRTISTMIQSVGDTMTGSLCKAFFDVMPNARLVNAYGQTGASPISFYECSKTDMFSLVPLGKPLPGVELHLDPVFDGSDICRLKLTGPITPVGDDVLYDTGDIVKWDDTLEDWLFAGRGDDLVLVNGNLVSPAEVEAALCELDFVASAQVSSIQDPPRLHAIIVPRDLPFDWAQVNAMLQTRLPRYMIPSSYELADQLEYSERGKIRRQTNAAPHLGQSLDENEVPAHDIELAWLETWKIVLQHPGLDVHDDLSALGADSLRRLRALAEIRRRLPSLIIPPRLVFSANTVRGLACATDVESS